MCVFFGRLEGGWVDGRDLKVSKLCVGVIKKVEVLLKERGKERRPEGK